MRWALITGEYPPQPGGVSDYTRVLAGALAAAGDEVHVWAPDYPVLENAAPLTENHVQVHRLPDRFGRKTFSALGRALDALPRDCRLLLQYVPHAFGWKAMNVPFCLWLASRTRQPFWVMYHEVAYPLSWSQALRLNALGIVTRGMASVLARCSERVYVSIPAWKDLLPKSVAMTWLPIPSTVPTSVSGGARACVRQRLAGNRNQVLIGHFGTFGVHLTPLLEQILPPLLRADSRRTALLLGGGSARFAQNLTRLYPDLEGRCIAPGALPGEELAAHLAACDILAQPYADGVSSRRTSLMAGLALGLPIVTTEGHLSEPLWRESRAVALAPVKPATAFVEQCEAVLQDPNRQAELRRRASELYEERFAVANTVRALRS